MRTSRLSWRAVVAAGSGNAGAPQHHDDYAAYLKAVSNFPPARRREAFDVAVRLLDDSRTANRCAAADLTGRLATEAGDPVDELFGRAVSALVERMDVEADEDVLHSLIMALGDLCDPAAFPALAGLVQHPAAEVRWAVAWALPGLVLEAPPPAVVEALVSLSRDEDDDVRNWATFGLASGWDIDTPDIRAALEARLSDEHVETREEAVYGLALRGDDRAIDILADLLAQDTVSARAIDTATEVADPRLLPALLELAQWWHEDESKGLSRAIIACGG